MASAVAMVAMIRVDTIPVSVMVVVRLVFSSTVRRSASQISTISAPIVAGTQLSFCATASLMGGRRQDGWRADSRALPSPEV